MLYIPLSPRTNHIRLLVLHPGIFDDEVRCDLVHHDIDGSKPRKFEALSYAWGDPNDNSLILLNGRKFGIRKNLEVALRNLRPIARTGNDVEPHSRYLWVDAICINQQDLRERSEQLLRMPQIYQAADTTIVWLGEGTAESDKAMDFMSQNDKRLMDAEADLLRPGNYREEYAALIGGLLLRPWWQRTWIVQEVTVSDDLIIMCGSKTVRWATLIKSSTIAHEYHAPAVTQKLQTVHSDEAPRCVLNAKLNENRDKWRESGPQPLYQLLLNFRSCQATVPIDKIYGLLGMAAEANHPTLKPDYQNLPQKVFRTVTRFIIEQHQKLDFICTATGPRNLDDLPSWTPDFTAPPIIDYLPLKDTPRLLERYLYSAAKTVPMAVSFSEDSSIMYADGIRADFIDLLAPYWHPDRPTEEFAEQLPEYILWAWPCFLQPEMAKLTSRYGPTFPLALAASKMMTADRVVDYAWRMSRLEPDKSWSDLPAEPPEGYEDEGTPETQLVLWRDDKRWMVRETIRERRYMITKSGYFGLVPKLAEAGDVICILFGCDTPLVLRPVDGHYLLIGESYVTGIMDGEIVDELQRGRAVRECFEIR